MARPVVEAIEVLAVRPSPLPHPSIGRWGRQPKGVTRPHGANLQRWRHGLVSGHDWLGGHVDRMVAQGVTDPAALP
jgi:hypothetical protein